MVSTHMDLSRRDVLRGAVAAGALAAGTGVAGADDVVEVNVGYARPSGRRAARSEARSVRREFAFDALTIRTSHRGAERLSRRGDVRYVEENGEMHALAQTLPWGIDRVDADAVLDAGETADGADVAVIDTGIDSDHPDLASNVGAGVAFVECKGNPRLCREPWDDDNDHGTHCAGIADAVDDDAGVVGVATRATLHAVKVLDKNGSGSFSDVAAGIQYVADQGWDVGSMSLGASSGSETVRDACQYAVNNGVFLVAAAGNAGPCTDCVGYPAAYDTVAAVSSTDADDALSSFSSTGPEVELAAPGGAIYSTVVGGYDTFSGTSMATPHVAGAAGHLMAAGASNAEARTQLGDTAEDLGLSAAEQGHGLLDVEAAVLDGDTAPSVSWVTPADGDTVAGTVTVQLDASDAEDADDGLEVTYTVDGGSTRTTSYDATSGYHEDDWDTTGVADGDHTLSATVTDSAGNSSSTAISVTTDNVESAPTVDGLSATEVETSDGDAEFDADWVVSDADGDLTSVELTLTDDTAGATDDTATVDVSGDAASGTTRLVAAGDDDAGHSYTVEAVVTDVDGNTDGATASVDESEPTNEAPTVDTYAVSEAGSPNPHAEITADWDVGDADGNLASVLVEVFDASGTRVDATDTAVSGVNASGTDDFQVKHADGETFDVTLTVTDAAGATATATGAVTE